MKKLIKKQPNSKDCFICGLSNDLGLKASFFETDENEIVCIFTPPSEHQSYPGRLHGGVAAAVLDETIGRAVQISDPDVWGVTVELKTCYKKPVPYNTQLRAVGRITSQNRRIFEGTGEIYTPDGEIAVTASGKYVKMRIDNISEGFGGDDWKVHLDINDPDKVDL